MCVNESFTILSVSMSAICESVTLFSISVFDPVESSVNKANMYISKGNMYMSEANMYMSKAS